MFQNIFNYGYGKLIKLPNQEADGLIGMVASIPFFGIFPLFSSWILALTETFAIFAFIYGYTNFSLSNFISRFTGFLCLIISIIIVYLHVFAWGDNLFSHGPFESLNIEENILNKSLDKKIQFSWIKKGIFDFCYQNKNWKDLSEYLQKKISLKSKFNKEILSINK